MEYNELMKALGDKLGLDEFAPDENGSYSLSINDAIVTFTELPQSGLLTIVSKVSDRLDDDGEHLYKILMTAMSPGSIAEDYTFFIDSENQCVYMRHTDVLANLDGDSVFQSLENFANTIDDWRHTISDFQQIVSPALNEALKQQAVESRKFGMNLEGFLKI